MAANAARLVQRRRTELLSAGTSQSASEALGQQLKTSETDPVTLVDKENEKALRGNNRSAASPGLDSGRRRWRRSFN